LNVASADDKKPGSNPKPKTNKWDHLYKTGLERVSRRENKTTEQIDWEKA